MTTTTKFTLTDATRASLLVAFVGEADSSEWGDAYLIRGARAISTCPVDFELPEDWDAGDVDEQICSDAEFVVITADYQGVAIERV